ncbi:endonuclease/exonuclease/phosphatase family protein [Aspergillus costaricaensis CBS 115574]|uniref:Endonuclease/exonuclease/phosphatase family protein n=1 Tax=Aspergillus costaricaensis CBS 115574 TaxID=1448317 RepID=A0ACD1IAW3_9EURO|nr:endonuclease/exonuclease/phosphatase family protein [Aspergillus costaricaensis CBS 115574]RAK87424.1 endonuclease/exonuclease/phosphatase family protein [Aspergillus costaricaensis CBS 115574]
MTSSANVSTQSPPLPADADAPPTFQEWYSFDALSNCWSPLPPTTSVTCDESTMPASDKAKLKIFALNLVTWNVDASAKFPDDRMAGIISTIRNQTPPPNILFFQEVPKAALFYLLNEPWIRENWYSNEGDLSNYGGLAFITVILLSKASFSTDSQDPDKACLGPVWRVDYPSKFDRDALCCDIFMPQSATRVRLVNVHLDSLAFQPSCRPRQLAIVASSLRCAGHGFVAGDFNPVLPEDDSLVATNGLVDVWNELHPDEPGFTWGLDGREPFPPGRLDKVAVLGLKGQEMDIIHPSAINSAGQGQLLRQLDTPMPWSDHSGLKCCLRLAKEPL